MAEDSLSAYTDKLLADNIFTCVECKSLLRTPIMLNEDLGNMCYICYDSLAIKPENFSENTTLEMILNTLKIPCKYQLNGCEERIIYSELENHHNNCRHHEKYCLVSDLIDCKWKGTQTEFLNHFEENHLEYLINSQNNSFRIEQMLNTNSNMIKLLKGKNEIFILKSVVNNEMNNLYYIICNSGDFNNNYKCTITHFGVNNINIQTQCKIMPYHDIYCKTDNNNKGIKIDMSALKQITQTLDTITIQIDFKSDIEELDEKLLNYFECPVCKNYMKPPIYQCHSGHSICNYCRPRLDKCPSCRGSIGNTRNFSLEGLTVGVHYPCNYHHLGCTKTLSSTDIVKHENICQYKPYTCPLQSCGFTGNYAIIANHLKSEHPNKLILSNYYRNTVDFRVDHSIDSERFHIIAYNNIFRLSFTRNSDYRFWAVEILGNHDENVAFVYEIGIIDMRKEQRKLIRTDLCLKEIAVEELFKKCIIFPNNILSSYSSSGLLTFYCQIHKLS